MSYYYPDGKCGWCGSKFDKPYWNVQKWCSASCGALYRNMEQRIKSQFFNNEYLRKVELEKLAKLGNKYRLPPREVD